MGFTPARPEELAAALLAHSKTARLERIVDAAPYGTKYVISGPMQTPAGRVPIVKSVWIIQDGQQPRFVTAMPGRAK
jgi:hypothetical protein